MDWPMAQRESTKKARAPRRAVQQDVAAIAEASAMRLSGLEGERDRLASELQSARLRIAELERLHDLAVNRIDWVLDSLHNLTEQES